MTIFVGGQRVATGKVGSDPESILHRLLEHPRLVEAGNAVKAEELMVPRAPRPSGNEDFDCRPPAGAAEFFSAAYPRNIYVFPREFATASPRFVQWIGTDELTTSLGVAVRDPSTGLTSVGHFDNDGCVHQGVTDLVESVISMSSVTLQLHLVGAFDHSSEHKTQGAAAAAAAGPSQPPIPEGKQRPGKSWPVALKMVETLQKLDYNFNLKTFCILEHNTFFGLPNQPIPAMRGFTVETSSGRLVPAVFEQDARGPDGTVRGVISMTSRVDKVWSKKLVTLYGTLTDTYEIHPFRWSSVFEEVANEMMALPDEIFVKKLSSSPLAEGPTYLPSNRRIFAYLKNFPRPDSTFPTYAPRVWNRTSTGGWLRKPNLHQRFAAPAYSRY